MVGRPLLHTRFTPHLVLGFVSARREDIRSPKYDRVGDGNKSTGYVLDRDQLTNYLVR